ncbi:MAG: carboxypeptidase-like regulatory domain-containing protein [Bacteroidales bacterium]
MIRNFIFVLLIAVVAIPVSGQEKKGTIKGKVVSASSNGPVPFATVVIFGTTTGAMTDFDGILHLPALSQGYTTKGFIGGIRVQHVTGSSYYKR